jgi:tripartite-type tricarboxylate transporter receptor subunit TctC
MVFYCFLTVMLSTFLSWSVYAESDDFYHGKVIRIIVGTAAGGGYDTYARAVGRHIGKHILGKPTVIVENMVGAGSIIAGNYLFKIAKPDGLTIGHPLGGVLFQQVLGSPAIEFDSKRFEYIGAPVQDSYAIGLSRASGITSIEKWLSAKTSVKLGASEPGGASYDVPSILKSALGLPTQIVAGYKGTSDIRLAVESGEVAGFCTGWESFKSTWRTALDSGEGIIVVQVVKKPHPELPNVPLAIDYAKTDEAKAFIRVAQGWGETARPFLLPPGVPKTRVQILRRAFLDTLKDPEFLAEAKKALLDINPVSGQELETAVAEMFKMNSATVSKLKEILK